MKNRDLLLHALDNGIVDEKELARQLHIEVSALRKLIAKVRSKETKDALNDEEQRLFMLSLELLQRRKKAQSGVGLWPLLILGVLIVLLCIWRGSTSSPESGPTGGCRCFVGSEANPEATKVINDYLSMPDSTFVSSRILVDGSATRFNELLSNLERSLPCFRLTVISGSAKSFAAELAQAYVGTKCVVIGMDFATTEGSTANALKALFETGTAGGTLVVSAPTIFLARADEKAAIPDRVLHMLRKMSLRS